MSDEEQEQKSKIHSMPEKAGEDTRYLDLHVENMRKKALAQRDDTTVGKRGKLTEGEEESEKKVSKEQFNTISLDY